jgi:hypothetical protein
MKQGEWRKSQSAVFMKAWLLTAAALFISELISAGVLNGVGLNPPNVPGAGTASFAMIALANISLAAGITLAGLRLGGSRMQRWRALAILIFVVGGINIASETKYFTTVGGEAFTVLSWLLPAILGGFVLARSGHEDAGAMGLSHWWRSRRPGAWAWRIIMAWAAYPFFYLLFGMLVAPIVVPYYQQQGGFLVVPPFSTMIPLVAVRSIFFMAAAVGIVMLWTGTRKELALRLGLAIFCISGLYGLLLGDFFPTVLRWTHGGEVLGASLTYAAAVAWLLLPARQAPK